MVYDDILFNTVHSQCITLRKLVVAKKKTSECAVSTVSQRKREARALLVATSGGDFSDEAVSLLKRIPDDKKKDIISKLPCKKIPAEILTAMKLSNGLSFGVVDDIKR